MSNPYQSPQPVEQSEAGDPSSSLGGDERKKLRKIARCHCLVRYASLANIGLIVLSVATSWQGRQSYGAAIASGVVMIGVIMFSMAATILLAVAFRNPWIGIIGVPLMVLSPIALFALLGIHQWVTNYLTDRGVKVGFLGAKPNSI